MFQLIAISLFIIAIPFSFADSCGEIRLDKKGGVMEKIPAFDQGEYGTCYAVAATQLYDAYRMKLNPKSLEKSSVYHAAMMNAVDSKDPSNLEAFNVDGGYPAETLELLIKNGSCDRTYYDQKIDVKKVQKLLGESLQLKKSYQFSKFHKNRNNFAAYEPASYKGPEKMASLHLQRKMEINSRISKFKHAYTNNPLCLEKNMNDLGIKDHRKVLDKLYKGEMSKFKSELKTAICPKSSTLRVGKIPKIITPSDTLDAVYAKRFKANNDMNKYFALVDEFNKKLSPDKNSPERTKFLKSWVGDKLEKNRFPISISYCAKKIGSPFVNAVIDDCGHHASVIIGRKKNPASGKCQILIRNSWGKTKNSWLMYNRNVKAEGENFWVDEDQIYSSKSLSLFTLE